MMVVAWVKVSDPPVMVSVTVPVVAALLAVRVNVLVEVAGFGLNEAVTPAGRPEAERLTLPAKPLRGVTVIVLVPVAPWVMLKLAGEAARLKLDGTATVSETIAVPVKLPDVPVMVMGKVPVEAVLLAARVNVLLPVVAAGLKDAVTPLGRPDADRLTLPAKPFCGSTVIVLVPLVPCVMAKLAGDAERV